MSDRFVISHPSPDFRLPPPRLIIYGQPKIGKTTFGSQAPSPIFIQTEDGAAGVQVPKIPQTPCTTWEELMTCFRTVASSDHECKTLVLDTVDRAEKLSQEWVLKNVFKGNQEKYMSYYKGPIMAGEKMAEVLNALDHIRSRRNMNIILISHDGLQKGPSMLSDDFKKLGGNVSSYAWTLLRDWADHIGHCTMDFRVVDATAMKAGKAKRVGKQRWIYFEGEPGRDAGCRVGYELPERIELNWSTYQEAMGDRING